MSGSQLLCSYRGTAAGEGHPVAAQSIQCGPHND